MEKSYLFQNYGYVGGSVNMKHAVIDLLRRYGIFIHMRDEPSGIYDIDKFLYAKNPMGIPYHQEYLNSCKKHIQECQDMIDKLESEEASDKLYNEYCKECERYYNEVILTNREYHKWMDRAEKSQNRIETIKNFINSFEIENQNELTTLIKNDLQKCINALSDDYKSYMESAVKMDVSKDISKPFTVTGKDEWVQAEVANYKDSIRFYKKRIKEEKEAIKNLKAKDEVIKAIFKALESFDKEVE